MAFVRVELCFSSSVVLCALDRHDELVLFVVSRELFVVSHIMLFRFSHQKHSAALGYPTEKVMDAMAIEWIETFLFHRAPFNSRFLYSPITLNSDAK